jgi:methyl-accepting chemotaxis protein
VATARNLEQQAAVMNDRVSVFRIGNPPGGERSSTGAEIAAAPAEVHMFNGRSRVRPLTGGRGPVRRMQTALATALKHDVDWKEF